MTDRRLQEAFAREAGRQASKALGEAYNRLDSVARATGEQKYEPLLDELSELYDRVRKTAGLG